MPKGKVRRDNGNVVALDMVWIVNDVTTGWFTVHARWNECQYSSRQLTREEANGLRDAVVAGGVFDEQLKSLASPPDDTPSDDHPRKPWS